MMRFRMFALCALIAAPAQAEPMFRPVSVPEHQYTGGWEHFVGGGPMHCFTKPQRHRTVPTLPLWIPIDTDLCSPILACGACLETYMLR